jgi:hypothetical protein
MEPRLPLNAGVVENDRQEVCNWTNGHPVEIFEDDLHPTVKIIGCGVSHVSLGEPGFDIERRVSEYVDSSPAESQRPSHRRSWTWMVGNLCGECENSLLLDLVDSKVELLERGIEIGGTRVVVETFHTA